MKYIERLADRTMRQRMRDFGAVLVEGCKLCGKSTTAEQFATSSLRLQDPEVYRASREAADVKISLLLEGERPRLIDEWGDIPEIWDAIRYDVDQSGKKGQYILTGSRVPSRGIPRHTGTGRFARILMRPMSLLESGDSNGAVTLTQLFKGKTDIAATAELGLEDLAFLCMRGGWPQSVAHKPSHAQSLPLEYIKSVAKYDLSQYDGISRDSERGMLLLQSLARNISSNVSMRTLQKDMTGGDAVMSTDTITDYLHVLRKLFIIENVKAWSPALRSRTAIRTSAKREFVDPSLAMAALRITDKDLLRDLHTFGLMFENLVIRDLAIYAECLDGDVHFYRDANGLECDAVVHLANGQWGAVEIKLGNTDEVFDHAAADLLKLAEVVDTEKMNQPAFLMIVTGTGRFAYRRKDGVLVVPVGCLGV